MCTPFFTYIQNPGELHTTTWVMITVPVESPGVPIDGAARHEGVAEVLEAPPGAVGRRHRGLAGGAADGRTRPGQGFLDRPDAHLKTHTRACTHTINQTRRVFARRVVAAHAWRVGARAACVCHCHVRTFPAACCAPAAGIVRDAATAFRGPCGTCRRKCSRRRSRLAADSASPTPPRNAAARSAKATSGTAIAATRPPFCIAGTRASAPPSCVVRTRRSFPARRIR